MNSSLQKHIATALIFSFLLPMWLNGMFVPSQQTKRISFPMEQTQALSAPAVHFYNAIQNTHLKVGVYVIASALLLRKFPVDYPVIVSGMTAALLQEEPFRPTLRASMSWKVVLFTLVPLLVLLGFPLGDLWTNDQSGIYAELLISSVSFVVMLMSLVIIGADYGIKTPKEVYARAHYWRYIVPLSILFSWHDGLVWASIQIEVFYEKMLMAIGSVLVSLMIWTDTASYPRHPHMIQSAA